MTKFGIGLLAALLALPVESVIAGPVVPARLADEAAACRAGHGSLMVGTVIANEGFQRAHGRRRGVWLSHTHLLVKADADGKSYDVAIDNVFALGYVKNVAEAPASLAAIRAGERIELCGALYSDGTGIHYVHSNCGEPPRPGQADGWVKEIGADGRLGENLESNQAFCRIFD